MHPVHTQHIFVHKANLYWLAAPDVLLAEVAPCIIQLLLPTTQYATTCNHMH